MAIAPAAKMRFFADRVGYKQQNREFPEKLYGFTRILSVARAPQKSRLVFLKPFFKFVL